MKLPQNPPPLHPSTEHQKIDPRTDRRVTQEMRDAANGLESVFTQQMLKVMRGTVEESEFSLHNTATEVYQGMLDQEYSDMSARQNSLGLSNQILDYWLRSMPSPQYNDKSKDPQPQATRPVAGRTGGTNEGQSIE
jgi:Rod binding domain-containing protein